MISQGLIDPFKLKDLLWPDVVFYREQQEIIRSVDRNVETHVRAGNQLGKDFVAGFICLSLFLRAMKAGKTCRIVTTSVKEDHLRVLWAEIARFVMTAKHPLTADKGGPLIMQHMEIRRADEASAKNPVNYLVGMVSEKGEGLAGHHAEVTLAVGDEASGIEDKARDNVQGWAKRLFWFGNPWSTENFWRKEQALGDLWSEEQQCFFRKVIKVRADDSPNVRFARAEEAAGRIPSGRVLVPGVLTLPELLHRRATWSKQRQCVGLDAEFYDGPEEKLFPLEWLNLAEERARQLGNVRRKGRALGCDPAEGGDMTTWAVVDEQGLIQLLPLKTPDTTVITDTTIALGRTYGIEAENWVFDRGGGGKQHADRLRKMGHRVRTVAFGEAILPDIKRSKRMYPEKMEVREDKQVYFNRRAEMYGELSDLLNPGVNPGGFALVPQDHVDPGRLSLRDQLLKIPREYEEGKLKIRSKNRKPGQEEQRHKTLVELIGHSPDEADALVLAVHGMLHKAPVLTAGAAV